MIKRLIASFMFSCFVSVSACDIVVTGPTINNENNNTNTNNIDIHDIGAFTPSQNPSLPITNPNGGTEIPLTIPSNSQSIAQTYANSNQVALSKSCQDTYGESAWLFMDGLILNLRNSDSRWGYLVKYSGTGEISRDVIAYRATSDNTGTWAVDVIIDHCGSPKFSWNVLGFDASSVWANSRK